jgi:hypothetical protein
MNGAAAESASVKVATPPASMATEGADSPM